MNLLRFTPKLAASMLVVTGLLASHAHAQLPGGSQSQLRPPSGGKSCPKLVRCHQPTIHHLRLK